MHWMQDEMKDGRAWRWLHVLVFGTWCLVALPVARICIDNQNQDLAMPTHQSGVQEGFAVLPGLTLK